MGWFDTAKRVGLGVATGGLSELPVTGPLIKDAMGNAEPAPGSVSPEEYRAARDRANARYDAAGNRINDVYQDTMEDRAAARGWNGTTPIRDVAPIQGKDLAYHDVAAPRDSRVFDPGSVEAWQAAQVQRAPDVSLGPIGAAQTVSDTQVAPAAQAGQTTVGRTAIDTAPANQIRDIQTSNLARLQRAADGKEPSQAEALLKQGLADSGQQALATAAAARGSARAGARRQAIQQIGEKGFQASQAGAALKAKEIADARNALASATTDVRGADTATATDQAHLTAQAQALQAQIDAARASGNASEVNRLLGQQAQLTATAKQFNAAETNARVTDVTKMRLGADTSNADRAAAAAAQDAAAANTSSAARAAAANARADNLAATRTATDANNVNRDVAVQTGNADRGQASDIEAAREWIQQQTTNNEQGVSRDVSEANRGRGDFAAQAGAVQGATGQGINAANLTLQQAQMMTSSELASMAAQGSVAAQQEQARRQAEEAARGTITKIGSAFATGGGSLAVPGGADFGANNAPSTYGGNTVQF